MGTLDTFTSNDAAANGTALLDLIYSDDEFALLRETMWIYAELTAAPSSASDESR